VEKTKLEDLMTKLQYAIGANATPQEASEIFNIHPIRRLSVVQNGEIIGIITARDVAKRCIFECYNDKAEQED
jgi:predicted transcriptional regulator